MRGQSKHRDGSNLVLIYMYIFIFICVPIQYVNIRYSVILTAWICVYEPSAMISGHNHRLKSSTSGSCIPVLPFFNESSSCLLRHWKARRCHFFFSIALIYISQSPFIKTPKNGVTFAPGTAKHTGIDCNVCMLCFCARRVRFDSRFGIVLMGWSLVCACWQSVRNICFGRCCGHMIPSIHKVPACPFTALYTVSHCTDDHTMVTFSVFSRTVRRI